MRIRAIFSLEFHLGPPSWIDNVPRLQSIKAWLFVYSFDARFDYATTVRLYLNLLKYNSFNTRETNKQPDLDQLQPWDVINPRWRYGEIQSYQWLVFACDFKNK